MNKTNKEDNKSEFSIKSRFEPEEFYREIRDCKRVYAQTTFDRAIPYAKDGLITVYRRILYDMYNQGYTYNSNTRKSAKVVGDLLGSYHPHGDSSVYNAMVTLASDWDNNEAVVQGQGNWSNVLGDSAAAYRYTECKLSKFFCDIVEEISPNFVNYVPNFDNTTKEVEYIPFKIPYVLINGTYGIAESYVASFPCHNVRDVVDICIKYINNKSIANEDLVDGFFPDFPNYGIITNKTEIENYYKYGTKANIKMKATLEIDRENKKIYVRDLPYGMTLANISSVMIKKTAEKHAVLSKITNVVKIDDPMPIRNGEPHMEFEVLFDKNSNILEIAREFEKACTMKTLPLNFILNYGDAKVANCNIKEIIKQWYQTLYITKHRKYGYYSTNTKTKEHIQEGLLTIYDHMDEIINFIKNSKSNKEIIDFLIKKYKLSEVQAEAISNMQLKNLSRVSKETLIKTIENLKQTIKELDEKIFHIDDEIIEDLLKIKSKYGRPRRTVVIDEAEEREAQSSIAISNGMVVYSHNQYAIFDTQSIVNGKTIMNGLKSFKVDGHNIKEIEGCHKIDNDISGLIMIDKTGIARRIDAKDLIVNNWMIWDDEISNIIPIESEDEKILVLSERNKIRIFDANQISKQKSNIGKVKKAIKLNPNLDSVLFLSQSGKYHCINVKEVPELGKSAVGILINLPNEKIDMIQLNKNSLEDSVVVTILDQDNDSFIMRFDCSEFEITNRANKGKTLAELDGYKFGNCNLVNMKMKDSKCALIGRFSTSQISIGNLKTCESGIDTKKVPVETIGILQYVI